MSTARCRGRRAGDAARRVGRLGAAAALATAAIVPAQGERVSGVAWPGATVRIVGSPILERPWLGPRVDVTLVADGRGRFAVALPIGIDAVAWAEQSDADGRVTLSAAVPAVAPVLLAADGAARAPIPAVVRGLATWTDAAPAELRAIAPDLGGAWRAVPVPADGDYLVPPLPGDLVFELVDRAGVPLAHATAGDAGVRLVLPMPEIRRLRVFGADGAPAAARLLAARAWQRTPLAGTGPDGRLAFAAPPRADHVTDLFAVPGDGREHAGAARLVAARDRRDEFVTDVAELPATATVRVALVPPLPGARAVVGGFERGARRLAMRVAGAPLAVVDLSDDGGGTVVAPVGARIGVLLGPDSRAALPAAWRDVPWAAFAPYLGVVRSAGDLRAEPDSRLELVPLRLSILDAEGLPAAGARVRVWAVTDPEDPLFGPRLLGTFHSRVGGRVDLLTGAARTLSIHVEHRGLHTFATLRTGDTPPVDLPEPFSIQVRPPIRVAGRWPELGGTTITALAAQPGDASDLLTAARRLTGVDARCVDVVLRDLCVTLECRVAADGTFAFELPWIATGWQLDVAGLPSIRVPADGSEALERR